MPSAFGRKLRSGGCHCVEIFLNKHNNDGGQ